MSVCYMSGAMLGTADTVNPTEKKNLSAHRAQDLGGCETKLTEQINKIIF